MKKRIGELLFLGGEWDLCKTVLFNSVPTTLRRLYVRAANIPICMSLKIQF